MLRPGRRKPDNAPERAKYRLAEATFTYIAHLTSLRYAADQLVFTNLCNAAVPHAPANRTVYIPEQQAEAGIDSIRSILRRSRIEVVFAMSQQVNYWLQRFGFYTPVPEFLENAEPKSRGVNSQPPYYEPRRSRAFLSICGNRYQTDEGPALFPILHVKSWPLRGAQAKAYTKSFDSCVNELKQMPRRAGLPPLMSVS